MQKMVTEVCRLFRDAIRNPDFTTRLALLVCLLIIGFVIFRLMA